MPRDFAFRRRLAAASLLVVLLMAACATVTNTPAQDEAWRRWEACVSQAPGSDVRNVQLDGRISFWAISVIQGRSMLDCLARAGKDGPVLPAASFATRPGGA